MNCIEAATYPRMYGGSNCTVSKPYPSAHAFRVLNVVRLESAPTEGGYKETGKPVLCKTAGLSQPYYTASRAERQRS